MIIKSMPRKDASFGQLINYITDEGKAEEQYYYGHNTFSNNPEEALKAMEENAQHVKARKNGNYMYHEVVSITRAKDLDETRQKEALRDITIKYVEERAKNNLAFCSLHDDHEGHLHYHVMISANEIGTSKKTRLSKSEFEQVKKNIERYTLENYPELKQALVIGRQDAEKKTSIDKETQVKRRGKASKVENIGEAVGVVLRTVKNEAELKERLSHYGFEYYRRGKTPGVIDSEDNKKYRFKRLGLLDEFQAMLDGKEEVNEPVNKSRTEDKQKEENNDELKSKDILKEWVLGDFEKRERKAKTDKINKRKEKAKEGLNAKDKAKEWIFGDFSAREEIKAQKDYEKTRDNMRDNPNLSSEEKRKEWTHGDFTAREELEKAQRIKKWLDKREEEKIQAIRKQREKEIKQTRKKQKENNNSKNLGRHK